MGSFDLARLIAWICLIFWLIWYSSVQLERLNTNVFREAKTTVLAKLEKSSGALRFIGIVLYSPYIWPVVSVVVWLLLASALFIFNREI
ncbi:MAG: hypothetical protein PHD68_08500 [Rugosibacter sp.]|nr:hypothetical protein [Rugosibacter sp.]